MDVLFRIDSKINTHPCCINKYADPQAFVNALKTKDLPVKFFTRPND
ncbi:MAG: hypothetical protein ACTTKX_07365 [Treponema sp.]